MLFTVGAPPVEMDIMKNSRLNGRLFLCGNFQDNLL